MVSRSALSLCFLSVLRLHICITYEFCITSLCVCITPVFYIDITSMLYICISLVFYAYRTLMYICITSVLCFCIMYVLFLRITSLLCLYSILPLPCHKWESEETWLFWKRTQCKEYFMSERNEGIFFLIFNFLLCSGLVSRSCEKKFFTQL